MLDKSILLCSGMAEIYMLYDFFDNLFEVKEGFAGRKRRIPYIFAVCLLFCINLFENTYLNLFGAPILFFLYVSVQFQASAGSRILHVLIVDSIIVCGEVILTILVEVPPRLMRAGAIGNLAEIPWQLLTAKLITYMILIMIKQLSKRSKYRIPKYMFFIYISQSIASLAIMMLSYYANQNISMSENFKICMTVGFAILIFGNAGMFYAWNRYAFQMSVNMEQKMTIVRQNAETEYYRQAAKTDQHQRAMIHDMVHYLKTIGELAKEERCEKILEIVKDTTGEISHAATAYYSSNPVLNAVLNEKKQEGEKRGLHMDIYVEPGLCTEGLSDRDIICIAGNLLENSVRAASECGEEGYVQVRAFMQKGAFVLKVTNPYRRELKSYHKFLFTTKKEVGFHGIGLKNVERTAAKYNGFLEWGAKERIFTASVVLFLDKQKR